MMRDGHSVLDIKKIWPTPKRLLFSGRKVTFLLSSEISISHRGGKWPGVRFTSWGCSSLEKTTWLCNWSPGPRGGTFCSSPSHFAELPSDEGLIRTSMVATRGCEHQDCGLSKLKCAGSAKATPDFEDFMWISQQCLYWLNVEMVIFWTY